MSHFSDSSFEALVAAETVVDHVPNVGDSARDIIKPLVIIAILTSEVFEPKSVATQVLRSKKGDNEHKETACKPRIDADGGNRIV